MFLGKEKMIEKKHIFLIFETDFQFRIMFIVSPGNAGNQQPYLKQTRVFFFLPWRRKLYWSYKNDFGKG